MSREPGGGLKKKKKERGWSVGIGRAGHCRLRPPPQPPPHPRPPLPLRPPVQTVAKTAVISNFQEP